MIAELGAAVRAARREADWEAANARTVGIQGKAAQAEVARLTESLERHAKVLGVLTRCGEERQESVQRQVEVLVTHALRAIFSENLSFRLVPEVKGNRVEISFVLVSSYPCPECIGNPAAYPAPGCPRCEQTGTQEVQTPVLGARGGGMACVVGFVLRLVVLMLTPGARRILFLDESFGMVSAEYEPRVAEFLREVADKAGVQIVLITHSRAYDDAADKAYELSLGADGATRCVQDGTSR